VLAYLARYTDRVAISNSRLREINDKQVSCTYKDYRRKGQQARLIRIVTDTLRSYSAENKELIPSLEHSTQQYENNRCELSHQPSRQQERQMRKFTSQGQAQRVLSCHGVINNLFRIGVIE
jgi:putative transposase